jgi:hypothetical protein
MTTFGYTLAFEGDHDGKFGMSGHRKSTTAADGTETNLDEAITVSLGPHTGTIKNGKFTIDGKDCGTVKPGDTIKVAPDGSVSVNGVSR